MTRRLFVAAAAAAVALTASACSGGGIDAGAAAIVGDRRISVADVQTATSQVNRIIDPEGQNVEARITQRDVLGYLIQVPYVVSAASANGLGVSENDAREIFSRFGFTDPVSGSKEPDQASVDVVRAILARQRINPQQDGSGLTVEQATKVYTDVSAELQKTDIRVNPRYGTFTAKFDPQDIFRVKESTPSWLVTPDAPPAEATPAPAAS